VIYLLNRRSDKAQAVLRATRSADLSNEIRIPRLLIEARALSDSGRHDFALEVIAGSKAASRSACARTSTGRRGTGRRRPSTSSLLYGDRWKSFEPLSDIERPDILRAAVAYAMAEDQARFGAAARQVCGEDADGPDRRAFDLVTGGIVPTVRNSATWRDRGFGRHADRLHAGSEGALSGAAGQLVGRRGVAAASAAPATTPAKTRSRTDRLGPAVTDAAADGALKRRPGSAA